MKVKTLDIKAKEWFDKINGNSYFSCVITINFGLKNQIEFKLPFQYGYGDQYLQETRVFLQEKGLLPKIENWNLSEFYKKEKIIIRSCKIENCKKAEVKEFGRE
jgi:hypothetical protein